VFWYVIIKDVQSFRIIYSFLMSGLQLFLSVPTFVPRIRIIAYPWLRSSVDHPGLVLSAYNQELGVM
jgi:hypothetical protein